MADEIRGEAALDALAEMIDPLSEILSDKEIAEVFETNKIKAVQLAIKNHKKAIIQIIALNEGKTYEECLKGITPFTLPAKFLKLLNSEEVQQLFI